MSTLTDIRAHFKVHKAPFEPEPEDGADVSTYATVRVNGMTPEGQQAALAEAAREMGWPHDATVMFVEGHYALLADGKAWRLPFDEVDEAGEIVVVVPTYNARGVLSTK